MNAISMRDVYSEEIVLFAAENIINLSEATIALLEEILKGVAKDPRTAPSAIIGLDHSMEKLSEVLTKLSFECYMDGVDRMLAMGKIPGVEAKKPKAMAAKKAKAAKAKTPAKKPLRKAKG